MYFSKGGIFIIIIGLTGPSGSGKTTLCALAKDFSIDNIDADKVYHALLVPPSPCLDEIVESFGSSIMKSDKTLNRVALASLVFSDQSGQKLKLLNKITHKYVKSELKQILSEMKKKGSFAVLVDAPTLFESGFDKECDFTVALLASNDQRSNRIIERDGLTEVQAQQRLSAQKSDSFFKERADHIIINNSDIDSLRSDLLRILKDREVIK